MFLILLVVSLLLSIIFYLKNYNYWKVRGVPGPIPYPLVGNIGPTIFLQKSIGEVVTDIYNEYSDYPVVGIFRGASPSLLVRDPELIKDITTKYFNSFHDNDVDINSEQDRLIGRNPFILKGERWPIVREQLTPCFTSEKMKSSFPILEMSCRNMIDFLYKQVKFGNTIEAKQLSTKLTICNVSSYAFGIESRCFTDPEDEFLDLGKKFLTPTGTANFMIIMFLLFPFIMKFINVKVTPKNVEERIINMINDTLKFREQQEVRYNDFLEMMNHLKKTSKKYEFTNIDVAAHAAGFFIDGYETSSIVMSFMLYELAANIDVQEKLRIELKNLFENDGTISYESINTAKYLDAVLNETIRLHPPLMFALKRCTDNSYTMFIRKTNNIIDNSIVIEKGTSIIIPTFGIQTDSLYFEKPHQFLPERFLNKNKNLKPKCVFMPFGEGPRVCLGKRFGILQLKLAVAYIVKSFRMSIDPKTKLPLKYDPKYYMTSPIGGLWIDFKSIE